MIGVQDFCRLVLTPTFNSTTVVCKHTPNPFGQDFLRDESKNHLGSTRGLLRADITSKYKGKGYWRVHKAFESLAPKIKKRIPRA